MRGKKLGEKIREIPGTMYLYLKMKIKVIMIGIEVKFKKKHIIWNALPKKKKKILCNPRKSF